MWVRSHYAHLLDLVRRGQRRADHAPKRWLWGAAGIAALLLLLGNAGRIAHMIRVKQLQLHPERSPNEAAAMWYERMAGYLARRGMKKSATQTAQEFVRIIEDEGLRTRVGRFTDAYESARFGNSPNHAQQLPELYEEVELATRK